MKKIYRAAIALTLCTCMVLISVMLGTSWYARFRNDSTSGWYEQAWKWSPVVLACICGLCALFFALVASQFIFTRGLKRISAWCLRDTTVAGRSML